jgi:hypothetical protein
MRREIIQEEDLDSLALDVNYIKRELDQIQDLEARLDAYELFIEKAFENIRKGTLVLLDPNTGTQVHPQANHYKDECNRIISEHLSSIVDSLKLLIYLDYKRKGENPEISPTSVGPIKWLADDASLVRLLQLLLKHNYINSKYADLCGIASGHFIDAYNQPFTNERLRKHFDHPESIEDKTITTKIQWNHTEAMIIYLIVQLIDRRIIQHRMDQYAHIIEEHFRNKKGNDFKSAQTQKVKADIDQYYFEEEIISEKRRKAKSLMESIVEQIGKSEPGS